MFIYDSKDQKIKRCQSIDEYQNVIKDVKIIGILPDETILLSTIPNGKELKIYQVDPNNCQLIKTISTNINTKYHENYPYDQNIIKLNNFSIAIGSDNGKIVIYE